MDFILRCNFSHNTRDVGFYTGIILETDKYTKVADGHFFTAKQTGEFQIKMRENNGKSFIAMLYNILLSPNLCDRLFSIIMLMNLGNTWLFHKGFCTVFFSENEQNAVTLPHSAKRKLAFLVILKGKFKVTKKTIKRKFLWDYCIIY